MDAERIMERVRRLLAIANDPAASDNEQRIALEQAQRLMDRHAIEEWQLEEDHDAIEIIRRMIHLEANPCNWYMAELANIVALGNRCRASYGWRRAGNGRNVVCSISIYGARSDVDKTEAIWTAMETSRAAMWRERARTTPRAKANAAWRNDTCKISHMCDILGVSAGHRPAGIPTVKGKSPMDTIRDWLAHAARSHAAYP